ncbi:MAG TPA: DNA sulfur modification protein DndB [Dehalococcoidia bacterium]|nr:DNA sulfur modification protein DndB [Dehalococcoidia bacterium]
MDQADFEMGIRAMPTRDGGNTCYDTVVTAGTVARFIKRGFLRIDDDHQRGRDTVTGKPQVDQEKIDKWTQDLIDGRAIIGTVMWNFRPEEGSTLRYDADGGKLFISGEATIPDSYHRHMALRAAVESSQRGSGFDTSLPVSVRIWGVSASEENRIFYALNQEGKPADATRAKWLFPKVLAQKLASEFVRQSPHLGHDNVDTVRDRLSQRNPRLAAFGTISRAFEEHFDGVDLHDDNLQANVTYMVSFWNELVKVLPELGRLNLADRQRARSVSLVDSANVINSLIGVGRMMKDSGADMSTLQRLCDVVPTPDGGVVPFFSRQNPLWLEEGVLVPGEKVVDGKRTLALRNSRQARRATFTAMLRQVGLVEGPSDSAEEAEPELVGV